MNCVIGRVHKSRDFFWGERVAALMSSPVRLRKGKLHSFKPRKYHIPSVLGSKAIDTEAPLPWLKWLLSIGEDLENDSLYLLLHCLAWAGQAPIYTSKPSHIGNLSLSYLSA